MVLPLLDVYEEHRDEAAFLRLRRARLDVMLEGDARHERMLEARLALHLDALRADVDAAAPLLEPWLAARDPHERYVALAALLPTARAGDAVARVREASVPAASEPAVFAALAAFGAARGGPLIEHWLGEGEPRYQALALRVLARWGDARVEKLARRALRRPGALVRRAALDALAVRGARDALGHVEALLAECAAPDEREDVLASAAALDRAAALEHARRLLAAGAACGAAGPVLCGAAGTALDAALLTERLAREPREAGVCVALALAGCHRALDGCWSAARDDVAASNALREAAYALLGGEVPPRVLGARAAEDGAERASRVEENARLRAQMRAVAAGTRGRWGAPDASELRARAERLGPRHRAWARLVCAG